MPIDPALLAVATPAELEAYELELLAETALSSPADYGEALAAHNIHLGETFKRPPHIDLISETLVKLVEGRLIAPSGKVCRKLMVAMPPRHGKELADDTPILTASGWTTHGTLRPGDRVFHPSGRQVAVLAVSEPSDEKMLVVFTDGTEILAHPNHEWLIHDRGRRQESRIVDTKYLASQAAWSGGRARFQMPHVAALDFPEVVLPMDPYALGAWLGDGTSDAALICGSFDDLEHIVRQIPYEHARFFVHATTGVAYQRFGADMRAALRSAGVWGDKHIPEAYFLTSEKQRRDLLAGLVDTDGSVNEDGRVRFVGVNERLVRQTAQLARSLGYRANVQRRPAIDRGRTIRDVHDMWVADWTPHDGQGQGTLSRKIRPRHFTPRRVGIRSVSPAAPAPGRCIQVDSPDGLYLAGHGLIPTHNSELISRYGPAWFLAKYPEKKVMVVGYSDDFAAGFGRDARTLIEAAPDYLSTPLRQDTKAASRWMTEAGGAMFTAGIGGPLTGRGGHYIVIDDPIKSAVEAQSATTRQAHWDWVQSTVLTRREPGAVVVLVMTRWSEDDLSGRFIEWEGDDWVQIVLPAIAGEDDPIGRAPGEALWPERIPLETLEEIRDGGDESMYWWSSMYQQSPTVEGGGIFQSDHFRYHSQVGDTVILHRPEGPKELPRASLRTFGVIDLAATTKTTSDYSVFALFGVTPERELLLLDRMRTRIEGPDHMPTLERLHLAWKPAFWGIEKATYGLTLLQTASRTGRIPVRELKPDTDKVSRAYSASALAMGGRLYFPKTAPWLNEFEHELLSFPNGAHDDQVDVLAYAAKILSDRLTPGRRAKRSEPETIEEKIDASLKAKRKRARRSQHGLF